MDGSRAISIFGQVVVVRSRSIVTGLRLNGQVPPGQVKSTRIGSVGNQLEAGASVA